MKCKKKMLLEQFRRDEKTNVGEKKMKKKKWHGEKKLQQHIRNWYGCNNDDETNFDATARKYNANAHIYRWFVAFFPSSFFFAHTQN